MQAAQTFFDSTTASFCVTLTTATPHPRLHRRLLPPKYRVINTSNPIFLRDVASVQGGMELMVALGFREDMDGQLVLPMVRESWKMVRVATYIGTGQATSYQGVRKSSMEEMADITILSTYA